jgi:hypothetical protein
VSVVVLQSSCCEFVDIELLRWTCNGDTLDLQWSWSWVLQWSHNTPIIKPQIHI